MIVTALLEQPCNKSDNINKVVTSCLQPVPNLLTTCNKLCKHNLLTGLFSDLSQVVRFLHVHTTKIMKKISWHLATDLLQADTRIRSQLATACWRQVCCKLSTDLLQIDCQNLLSTGLLQVGSTSCNKSANNKLQQVWFNELVATWCNWQVCCIVLDKLQQPGKIENLQQVCGGFRLCRLDKTRLAQVVTNFPPVQIARMPLSYLHLQCRISLQKKILRFRVEHEGIFTKRKRRLIRKKERKYI